jgi:hypothetical protein
MGMARQPGATITLGGVEQGRIHTECSLNHAECSLNHAECSLNHAECSLNPATFGSFGCHIHTETVLASMRETTRSVQKREGVSHRQFSRTTAYYATPFGVP